MNTKSKELVDKFYYSLPNNGLQVGVNNVNSRWEEAKKCASICCDEIIKTFDVTTPQSISYWQEVKNEIEKLWVN